MDHILTTRIDLYRHHTRQGLWLTDNPISNANVLAASHPFAINYCNKVYRPFVLKLLKLELYNTGSGGDTQSSLNSQNGSVAKIKLALMKLVLLLLKRPSIMLLEGLRWVRKAALHVVERANWLDSSSQPKGIVIFFLGDYAQGVPK